MRVAYVVHSYEYHQNASDLISSLFTVTDWMQALTSIGVEITVYFRFHKNSVVHHEKVEYNFIKDKLPNLLKPWNRASVFNNVVAQNIIEKRIQLIHAHNPFNCFALANLKKQNAKIPIIVQDHAGINELRHSYYYRYFLKNIDAFLFTAKGQEAPWVKNGIFKPTQVYYTIENSSSFKPKNKDYCRRQTGLAGHPAFLWVGNLNENKDPITVLTAFSQYLKHNSRAQLYMIYRYNDIENEVNKIIHSDQRLLSSVHLLGRKHREKLELYYNSSDYFISASHKEGSGYAMIEAMSCGSIPIVTSIPSFSNFTNNGSIGYLFNPGDAEGLYRILSKLNLKNLKKDRNRIITFFNENLSFNNLGLDMKNIYKTVVNSSMAESTNYIQ